MSNDNGGELMLSPNDLVGVIRQGLGELQAYLAQPVQVIDGAVCVARMERMTSFGHHLMAAQNAQLKTEAALKHQEQVPARKN